MKKKWPISFYIALSYIILLFLIALFAPWIANHEYSTQNLDHSFENPNWKHFFGTDALGRDLFSRLIYGTRISMIIASITALTSLFIGLVYGSIAGYSGGWIEKMMMRLVQILYTLPTLVVAILVMLIFGRGVFGLFMAMTVTGWLGTARLIRAEVKKLKSRSFVEASRSLGSSKSRTLIKHILPNCVAPLIVELTYQIPTNILAEAFLSFLGIGIPAPLPSWGVLAEEGWRTLQYYPHLIVFPGLMIFFAMLCFNLLGDQLRDKLDPHLQ